MRSIAHRFKASMRTLNFEGQWHLTVRDSEKAIAEDRGTTEEAIAELINAAKATLLKVRDQRVAPVVMKNSSRHGTHS